MNEQMNEHETSGIPMEWNDTIDQDGPGYILLPEGNYTFTVTDFQRGRFPGSARIPACNKAQISAAVDTPDGRATVKFDLILCRSLEWKLAAFFRCIGQKKPGEPLRMDWTKVPGSRGRAHFRPRSYTDGSGEERQVNDIDRFLDYDPEWFCTQPSLPEEPEAEEWYSY